MEKSTAKLFFGLFLTAGAITQASAVSLLDAATGTAITAGWTDMKDTILAILGFSWAPMLGIAAVLAAPRLVKSMFKLATGR